MMNNNDDDKTMSNSFDNSSSGFPIAEAVLSKPAQQQHQLGTSSALYKLAARNLREYHGVSSMTALKLEETVTLLGLRPRRLVARGLAPRRLLKDSFSPLVLTGDSSDEGQQELCEAETSLLTDASGDKVITNNNSSSSKDAEENGEEDSSSTHVDDGDSIDNINLHIDDNEVEGAKGVVQGSKAGKKKRPIHAALVAGGVDLLPRETRPLLRALGEGVALALASIFVLVGTVRGVWDGLVALLMALVAARSTEPETTPCTEGNTVRGKACHRAQVRTEGLNSAVFVTQEDVSKDLSGPATTACLPLGIALVPLVAASTDTDTGTSPAGMDAGMGTPLESFKGGEREREANVCAAEELVGLGNMVLVATEEGWVGLEALPMGRPMLTGALNTAALVTTKEEGGEPPHGPPRGQFHELFHQPELEAF
eukprot:jgi/Undpi1/13232/HiC_scaffold_8.g02894.m1